MSKHISVKPVIRCIIIERVGENPRRIIMKYTDRYGRTVTAKSFEDAANKLFGNGIIVADNPYGMRMEYSAVIFDWSYPSRDGSVNLEIAKPGTYKVYTDVERKTCTIYNENSEYFSKYSRVENSRDGITIQFDKDGKIRNEANLKFSYSKYLTYCEAAGKEPNEFCERFEGCRALKSPVGDGYVVLLPSGYYLQNVPLECLTEGSNDS